MAIERWDPFRELRSMREAMERFFQESWERPLSSFFVDWAGSIPVDASETDTNFVVRATIPGVRPEDIQINVQGDRLMLRAESQSEQEHQVESYLVRERKAAAYYRALTLPAPVRDQQADVHYEHGVLTITLPKAQPGKSSQIKVRGGDQSGQLSSLDRHLLRVSKSSASSAAPHQESRRRRDAYRKFPDTSRCGADREHCPPTAGRIAPVRNCHSIT